MKIPLPNQTKLVHHCRIHDVLVLCFGIHHIFLRIPGYFRAGIMLVQTLVYIISSSESLAISVQGLCWCRRWYTSYLPQNPWLFLCRDCAGVDVGIHHIFLRIPGYFRAGIMLVQTLVYIISSSESLAISVHGLCLCRRSVNPWLFLCRDYAGVDGVCSALWLFWKLQLFHMMLEKM